MRHLLILLVALVTIFTACTTTPSDPKEAIAPDTKPDATRLENVQDHKEEFAERVIDSLKYVIQTPLVDGIYLVQRHGKSIVDMLPMDNYEKLATTMDESMTSGAVEDAWTVLNRMHFVPLDLAGSPEKAEAEEGKAALILSLNEAQAEALEKLTTDYLGREVAIVIDEKVCTRHKIKAAITGGKVQISSCTLAGCEIIMSSLEDNVSN
jgi:hypothetical protein